ncbi:MAG TPA: response regulator [Caulobacteraceae bacterium]|jgi:CheY-like chemotaxis protein|nr:response regulator [Caulobacteraceae bacterium]
MILTDEKLARLLEPFLARVLIVEPVAASARLLGDLLKGVGARQIYLAQTGFQALNTCKLVDPQVVFTEVGGAERTGLGFVAKLRRSELACRQAPVIVVTAEATAAVIVAARNAGVHEFLRKPFAARDLHRRLEAALLHPRDWIEAVGYVGPDRRRFNSADYVGPRKRKADRVPTSPAGRLEQALKIAKSAVAALESDPAQALRSLQVQTSELKALAAAMADARLAAAAGKLQAALAGASVQAGLSRPAIEAGAADLWAFVVPEPIPTARAVA